MAFNTRTPKTNNKTVTFEGAKAVVRTPELELSLNILGSYMDTDTFYQSKNDRIKRVEELVNKVSPAFVGKLAVVARKEFNLRTPPAVLLALSTLKGNVPTSQVAKNTFFRGDEVMEYLSAVKALSKKGVFTSGAKKTAANVLNGMSERSALRYMGGSKSMSLSDAIRISHPVPSDTKQSALFKFITLKDKEGSLSAAWNKLSPYDKEVLPLVAQSVSGEDEGTVSWERARSANKTPWVDLVDDMGYMALLRNMRNFLDEVPGTDSAFWNKVNLRIASKSEVAKSKQMPYRFLSAYKAISVASGNPQKQRVLKALTDALDHSAYNLPILEGSTLVAVDTSASMGGTFTSDRGGNTDRYTPSTSYLELAALLGSAFAVSQSADLVSWASAATKKPLLSSVMATALSFRPGEVGHGTDPTTIGRAVSLKKYKNIVIFTDGQFYREADFAGLDANIYFVDLAGYTAGFSMTNKPNVVTIGGWSDATLKLITLHSKGGIVDFIKNYTLD